MTMYEVIWLEMLAGVVLMFIGAVPFLYVWTRREPLSPLDTYLRRLLVKAAACLALGALLYIAGGFTRYMLGSP